MLHFLHTASTFVFQLSGHEIYIEKATAHLPEAHPLSEHLVLSI